MRRDSTSRASTFTQLRLMSYTSASSAALDSTWSSRPSCVSEMAAWGISPSTMASCIRRAASPWPNPALRKPIRLTPCSIGAAPPFIRMSLRVRGVSAAGRNRAGTPNARWPSRTQSMNRSALRSVG